MRWRGQGILVGVVLLAAGAYGWQWVSVSKMVETLQVTALPIGSYTGAVTAFYAENQRFPEPTELTLPRAKTDLIRDVTLGKDGELTFELSAWLVFHGYVMTTMAPTLMPGSEPGSVVLSYVCVETDPSEFASVVCSRNGTATRAELAQENATFQANLNKRRESMDEEARAVARVQEVGTDCDRFVALAHGGAEQCVADADAQLGQRFAQSVKENFDNGRRLRPEVIASSPELLDKFNEECTSAWKSLVAMVSSANAEAGDCFQKQ